MLLLKFFILNQVYGARQLMISPINETGIDDIQSIFYQVIALLGVAIAAYLYINFRNNKRSKSTITLKKESSKINDYLQQIVNSIPYAACISDEKQRIIFSNPKFKLLLNSFQVNKSSRWDKQLEIITSEYNFTESNEIKIVNKQGQTLKIKTKPVDFADLDISLYTVVVENITNSETGNDLLNNIKTYLRSTLANTDFPVMLIDDGYKVAEHNIQCHDLLKMNRSKLNNRHFFNLFPDDERAYLKQIYASGTFENSQSNSFHIKGEQNNLIPIDLNLIPIIINGSAYTICLIKDISERLHMEKEMMKAKLRAEESDRLKSSFLANMSHEVRTPLNSIMGFTELMVDEQLSNKERKEFHNIVRNSSNELLSLLNDIMEFSKIESGLIHLNIDGVSPHNIIQEMSDYIRPLVSKNTNLQFNIKEPIGLQQPASLKTDKERVKQVLRHLLDNAVKFTYSGNITLSYQYRPDASIEFIVSDTGIGIAQKKIPNIFHKFRQANDENSRDFGGAGLGLSICKHLAKVLGGFLWVSSSENIGSDFHFVLPASDSDTLIDPQNKNIVFFTNEPKPIPFNIKDTKVLSVYSYTALVNIPLAHNIAAIILDSDLNDEELTRLKNITQLQSSTIIVYGEQSSILYSPISKYNNMILKDADELNSYLANFLKTNILS
ncbi:MAG: ATP-binding protein [Carboxylicivirga sp.]|nr:ATP-binding protein [Carboxylicivirga sp.]